MSTEVEIGRSKRALRAYSFDDIALVPARRTRDTSEVRVGWQIDAYHVDLPGGDQGFYRYPAGGILG